MIYHDVEIEDTANPIKQHPYRLNPVKQKFLKQEINYMLANKANIDNLIDDSETWTKVLPNFLFSGGVWREVSHVSHYAR